MLLMSKIKPKDVNRFTIIQLIRQSQYSIPKSYSQDYITTECIFSTQSTLSALSFVY